MSNVLSEEKKAQIVALGRLGWTLRRIQRAELCSANIPSEHQHIDSVRDRDMRSWASMPASARCSLSLAHFLRIFRQVLVDLSRFVFLFSRPRVALAAENLFLRKQLALFQERKLRPRRADDSTRWMMATLSRMFQWRDALVNVKPALHADPPHPTSPTSSAIEPDFYSWRRRSGAMPGEPA
jgi:hypothetical protein